MSNLMTKRIRNELVKDIGNKPRLAMYQDKENTISIMGSNIVIQCPQYYPFSPPKLKNYPKYTIPNCFWTWFGTVFMRPLNKGNFPSYTHCLCCTSPTCEWTPRKSLRDIVHHAICVQDARHAFRYRHIYCEIFKSLPHELVLKISDFA